MSRPKKRKSNNPDGRPANALTEVKKLVTGPAILFAAAEEMAKREGVSSAEWWRRAARERLGQRHPAVARQTP